MQTSEVDVSKDYKKLGPMTIRFHDAGTAFDLPAKSSASYSIDPSPKSRDVSIFVPKACL